MKKILYIILICVMCFGCSLERHPKSNSSKDSIVTVVSVGGNIEIPLDSFLAVKDSFVYVKDCYEEFWCTKEYYKWNYGYPDTIKVAFTRNGVVEDSVEAVRQGLVADSTGKYYSPAYVFLSVVGDKWIYDVNGKFIESACTVHPHSGAPHHYKP